MQAYLKNQASYLRIKIHSLDQQNVLPAGGAFFAGENGEGEGTVHNDKFQAVWYTAFILVD